MRASPAVVVWVGSALMSSTCPPDSVSIRMPPELPPWLVKPAPTRSMYHGTFCIESVAPWIAITPPPPRTNAWRFANSVALSAAGVQADRRVEHDRLVLLERVQIQERVRRQRDAGRGLAARALVDVRVPDLDVEAVLGPELLDHRLHVDDRLVPEAAGASVDEHLVRRARVGGERHRVPERADRLVARRRPRPTVTPVPLVSTSVAAQLGDQRLAGAGQRGPLACLEPT